MSSPSAPSCDAPEPDELLQSSRVAVVADSDTRWKWGRAIAAKLIGDDAPVEGWLERTRTSPTDRQVLEVGSVARGQLALDMSEVTNAARLAEIDVLVLALSGGRIFRVIRAVTEHVRSGRLALRPLIVTGYVGVVYEKEVDGFLLRTGADVLCVNSQRDLERFSDVADDLGIDRSALVSTGFPDADDRVAVTLRQVETLVFVVQPSVPERREERARVLDRLADYARAHPDRRVVVKLRARRNEQTTHPEDHHFEELASRRRDPLPANVQMVGGNMAEVLDRADLVVTVSSTAAVEALARGIPTAILTDLGIREEYGNHWFVGSGMFASFEDLIADRVPQPRVSWLARNGLGGADDFAAASERLAFLLAVRAKGDLEPPEPFYDESTAPEIVRRLEGSQSGGVEGTLKARARRVVHWILRGPAYRLYRRVALWADV